MDKRIARLIESVLGWSEAPPLQPVLQDVADTGREVVGVRYAAVGVLDDDGDLDQFIHSGMGPDDVERIGHLPDGHGLLGWQTTHARPLRLDDINAHPSSIGFPDGHPPMSTFLSAPIAMGDAHYGNIYMTDRIDGQPFNEDDEQLAVVLGAIAGAVVTGVRRAEELRRLTLISDRERIGRDLHDAVIQRLFAIGLQVQSLVRAVDHDPAVAERLLGVVDHIDTTIRTIRSTIFSLSVTDTDAPLSLRIRLLVVEEMARVLGFAPSLEIDDEVDAVASPTLGDELITVLRESLTNVARHADATAVDVRVLVDDGWLHAEVVDDGIGLDDPLPGGSGLGLHNMMRRAAHHGGEVVLGGSARGAEVRWRVPVTA